MTGRLRNIQAEPELRNFAWLGHWRRGRMPRQGGRVAASRSASFAQKKKGVVGIDHALLSVRCLSGRGL